MNRLWEALRWKEFCFGDQKACTGSKLKINDMKQTFFFFFSGENCCIKAARLTLPSGISVTGAWPENSRTNTPDNTENADTTAHSLRKTVDIIEFNTSAPYIFTASRCAARAGG